MQRSLNNARREIPKQDEIFLSDCVKWAASALPLLGKSYQCHQRAGTAAAKPPWQPAEWEMRIGRRARRRDTAYIAPELSMGLRMLQPLAALLRSLLSPLFPGLLDFLSTWNPTWKQCPATELWPSITSAICEKPVVNPSPSALCGPAALPTPNSGT